MTIATRCVAALLLLPSLSGAQTQDAAETRVRRTDGAVLVGRIQGTVVYRTADSSGIVWIVAKGENIETLSRSGLSLRAGTTYLVIRTKHEGPLPPELQAYIVGMTRNAFRLMGEQPGQVRELVLREVIVRGSSVAAGAQPIRSVLMGTVNFINEYEIRPDVELNVRGNTVRVPVQEILL